MAFNNEDKVSYKELAPSLKRLFKNLEKEIKERQIGYIDDNTKYIGRLKDKLTALENRDDLKELYKMAKNDDEESASGQVLKINPSKRSLYQHDEFLNRRIVSNQYEKEEEMLKFLLLWKLYLRHGKDMLILMVMLVHIWMKQTIMLQIYQKDRI